MKKQSLVFVGGFLLAAMGYLSLASTVASSGAKIATVSFKTCVDESKLGKKEQSRFNEMKKGLEETLSVKEKELSELQAKFKDDVIDTLSPQAEQELKEKFKKLSQEYSMQQNQYMQMMNQTQYQLVQKFSKRIETAATAIAKSKGIDVVLNEEGCFYYSPSIDISKEVIQAMDAQPDTDEETKK